MSVIHSLERIRGSGKQLELKTSFILKVEIKLPCDEELSSNTVLEEVPIQSVIVVNQHSRKL